MTSLVADLRCSWRIFRHSPGLALVAMAALAMGVLRGQHQPRSGAPGSARNATGVVIATPELFDLAEVRAMSGRLFGWQDDERAPLVTVVNQSFVRRFLTGVDPLGQRVRIGGPDLTIVGVVPELLVQDAGELDGSGLYRTSDALTGRDHDVTAAADGAIGWLLDPVATAASGAARWPRRSESRTPVAGHRRPWCRGRRCARPSR